ncbi:MAG: hypothetical protein LLG04_15325 [Parachlamydia sp.]|nr:hypothetical protein [Parachlamydia sp.]
MAAPANSLITVVQFGGHWVGMQIDAKIKTFITKALPNRDVARVAAQRFAQENRLPYLDDALRFNKPVVTIWKAQGCWVPAKIFPQDIIGAGMTTDDKNEAIKQARAIAEREQLEFEPSIGETAFM